MFCLVPSLRASFHPERGLARPSQDFAPDGLTRVNVRVPCKFILFRSDRGVWVSLLACCVFVCLWQQFIRLPHLIQPLCSHIHGPGSPPLPLYRLFCSLCLSDVRICSVCACVCVCVWERKRGRLCVDSDRLSCSLCSGAVIERAGQITHWEGNWVTPSSSSPPPLLLPPCLSLPGCQCGVVLEAAGRLCAVWSSCECSGVAVAHRHTLVQKEERTGALFFFHRRIYIYICLYIYKLKKKKRSLTPLLPCTVASVVAAPLGLEGGGLLLLLLLVWWWWWRGRPGSGPGRLFSWWLDWHLWAVGLMVSTGLDCVCLDACHCEADEAEASLWLFVLYWLNCVK